MTVHMFRCYIGLGKMAQSDLETRLDDWVASNAEWTDGNDDHQLAEKYTSEYDQSGDRYFERDVRFELSDAKANLQQKFEDKLVDKVGWYRIGYHECDHDESGREDCSFDPAEDPAADAREWTAKGVDVPAGVPDFPAAAYQ